MSMLIGRSLYMFFTPDLTAFLRYGTSCDWIVRVSLRLRKHRKLLYSMHRKTMRNIID